MRLRMAYFMTKEMHNKKNVSMNAKFRHYKATVRDVVLHAAETITLQRYRAEQVEEKERKIIRKIWEPKSEVKDRNEDQETKC